MDITKWTNGEAVDADDFTLDNNLHRRFLYDGLLMQFNQLFGAPAMHESLVGETLRPFGYTGVIRRASASTIRVNGGLWLYTNASFATPNPNLNTAVCAFKDSYEQLNISGFAGLGANFRRDIVQARVLTQNEAAVARDFKDAITGALSTQSLVKRNNAIVQYSVKQGIAGALITVAEPAADPGWFKIGSVLVRSTGVDRADEIFDWREPIGDNVVIQNAATDMADGSNSLSDSWSTNALIQRTAQSAGQFLWGTIPMMMPMAGALPSTRVAARRVRKARVAANWSAAATAAAVHLVVRNDDPSGGSNFTRTYIGSDVNIDQIASNQFGLAITSGTQAMYTLYDAATSYYPLWTNGRFSPQIPGTSATEIMGFRFVSDASGDQIYFVEWELMG